ncbi:MAG: hypothetical protein QGG26_11700 [Candidatus Undinarchaeales archaeon]|nr:hypothetical protein [Candidatus Undinarchaeales archaeon]
MAIGLQIALFILQMVFSTKDSDLRPISMFSVLLVLFFSGPGLGLILFQSKRQGLNGVASGRYSDRGPLMQ